MNNDLKHQIDNLDPPSDPDSFSLIGPIDKDGPFFGKNYVDDVCFVIPSHTSHPHYSSRQTNELVLILDADCSFTTDGDSIMERSNVLICKNHGEVEIASFIRLCSAFSTDDLNSDSISDLFSTLVRLFSTKNQSDSNRIMGLFGELYLIRLLDSYGCDISDYWQKKNLMKFDFMINATRCIEVKTTSKSDRIHHFKHEQLFYEDYDIIVASVMIRESNEGISMLDVVNYGRERYKSDYSRLNTIESIVSNYSDDDLDGLIFDETYIRENIRFVPAKNIPRFKEKRLDNLSNAEYDCNLSGISGMDLTQLINWIRS